MTPNGLKSRCEPCGLYSTGNRPLRSAEGHQAHFFYRLALSNAHGSFDRLWKTNLVSRELAYELLAEELGIEPDQAHMSKMDTEMARRVPPAVKAIKKRLKRIKAGEPDV